MYHSQFSLRPHITVLGKGSCSRFHFTSKKRRGHFERLIEKCNKQGVGRSPSSQHPVVTMEKNAKRSLLHVLVSFPSVTPGNLFPCIRDFTSVKAGFLF